MDTGEWRMGKKSGTNRIKLVVGLGNPGDRYYNTRHNAGHLAVEELARSAGLEFRCRRGSDLAFLDLEGEKVALARPRSFMNRSGEAVKRLRRHLRLLPQQILVVYDDIDLEPGVLRIRRSGSSGGHLGLESVIQHLGTENFPRLRIGVGRPPQGMEAADYVLEPLDEEQAKRLQEDASRAAKAVMNILTNGIERAMNEVN